jgi:hypothetical protein
MSTHGSSGRAGETRKCNKSRSIQQDFLREKRGASFGEMSRKWPNKVGIFTRSLMKEWEQVKGVLAD